MDTETLEALLHQAEAQLQQAHSSVATTQSQLSQRESERGAALAVVDLVVDGKLERLEGIATIAYQKHLEVLVEVYGLE